jgi:transcriptional regulator with PAS, ATPase and Fis domain
VKGELFQKLEDVEKDHIIRALAEAGHNRTKAAKLLGVSVRTLRNKVTAYKKEAKTEEDLAKLGLDAD